MCIPKRRERSCQNYCIDSNQILLSDENQQVQVGLPTHHELHTGGGGQSSSLSSDTHGSVNAVVKQNFVYRVLYFVTFISFVHSHNTLCFFIIPLYCMHVHMF